MGPVSSLAREQLSNKSDFNIKIYIIFNYVCVSVDMCICHSSCLQRREEGFASAGARVTDWTSELPNMGTRDQTWLSAKAVCVLNFCMTSLAPCLNFFLLYFWLWAYPLTAEPSLHPKTYLLNRFTLPGPGPCGLFPPMTVLLLVSTSSQLCHFMNPGWRSEGQCQIPWNWSYRQLWARNQAQVLYKSSKCS